MGIVDPLNAHEHHRRQELLAIADQLEAVTRQPYAKEKRGMDAEIRDRLDLGDAVLRPHHYDDPFFQELPVTDTTTLPGEASAPSGVTTDASTRASSKLNTAAATVPPATRPAARTFTSAVAAAPRGRV